MGFSKKTPTTSPLKNMMFAHRIVYGLSALLAFTAFAHPTKEATEPSKLEIRETVRDTETLNRRALLRASLRSQPVALVQEAPANAGRLLTDQKRADLRRQLQQQ